jgi:hypothetical protein
VRLDGAVACGNTPPSASLAEACRTVALNQILFESENRGDDMSSMNVLILVVVLVLLFGGGGYYWRRGRG